ncbi:hypothetical protein BCR33DRAFT_324772 [Rhizoclosmatium globosum]|uniref:F-box domain-containing protein n=1 Tax=Rhizoclosmatium globosum TaxID=329046 RepID=A0A1Y2D228_9FUNG|nr:hypothetical protein BCR33DRAFT_324772 [Rhizoclosmatium globosum]|eukprot:ORY52635.1 hypothetical protein BCR33DRAFT_324772 [Rhizoclosmatium globosum]
MFSTNLSALPIELLLEICFYSKPSAILTLTCCNKRLSLLAAATSRIWHTVWLQLGYPELPPGVSPHVTYKTLVLLVTRQGCQFCDAKNTRTIEWFELRRVCPRCSYSGLRIKKLPDVVDPGLPRFTKWVMKVIKPTKPRSAYVLFGNANRDRVRKEHPGIPFSQWGKIISKMWLEVTEDEKMVSCVLYFG